MKCKKAQFVDEMSEESECTTVSNQLFLGFGYGDVFEAFVRSEILKSYVSDIFLIECDNKLLPMVGNSASENMNEDLDVDVIQCEVTIEEEFQAPLATSDGLLNSGSWKEISSTPVKVDRVEREDNETNPKPRLSEKKKRSSADIQTQSTISCELPCETESSQWNTVHSPLLFTPVKGENTYGAGYLSQSSSNYSVNRVGSASKIHNSIFSTPPPKSVKKLSLTTISTDHQPEETNIKSVKINGCVSRSFHPTSLRCEDERNISPEALITVPQCGNVILEPSGITDKAYVLATTCGINNFQNCEVVSHTEFETCSRFDGEDGISSKPVKFSPPNSSLIPLSKDEERLRSSASLGDKKYSRVPPKSRRNHRLRTLLSRLRRTLNGLPPPPLVTIPQLTVTEMLEKIYKSELANLGHNSTSQSPAKIVIPLKDNITSLFHPSATEQEVLKMPWPDVLDCVHLGVCYNLGCSSETLEDLCQQVREKYVGNETASSCSIWSLPKLNGDSNHKKSAVSLANNIVREGYITRRRRAFSIASLSKAAPSVISKSRQILVNGLKKPNEGANLESKYKKQHNVKDEIKKDDVKSSFPRKSFGEKGGSAKKRSSIRRLLSFDEFSGNHGQSSSKSLSSSKQTVSPLLPSTKRVLTFGSGSITKNKMEASPSPNLPCTSEASKDSQEHRRNQPICSASTLVKELSEVHKKKLLWAVAQALRSRGLGTEHGNFKICAIPLFKQCREEFLNSTRDTRRESAGSSDGSDSLCPSVGSSDSLRESTSDKMLAIALGLVDNIMREVGVAPVIKERVK
ncbi:hypothetical protein J437_LFUL004685 [Ladona fulva]|uniref:Uncharacterized protein n=1 Tax=Ladona fulva TaxID=123851 RepID=A0A8K0KV19_LADFU|nr:hypothetical protein J437_LFUL004685 [Ladona fulva]